MPKRDDSYMAERRDEILDAAVACLLRTGLAGLSTNAICKEAGISMGALYTHFATKDEILVGIAERANQRRRERVDIDTLAAFRKLVLSLVDDARSTSAQEVMRVDIELLSAATVNEDVARAWAPYRENKDFLAALKKLKAKGEINPEVDPLAAATAIDGLLFGFAMMHQTGGKYTKSHKAAMTLLLDTLEP